VLTLSFCFPFHLPPITTGQLGVGIELNKMIYVHCQSGKRAQEAAALLTGMRYSNVMALGTTFEEISAAMPTAEGTYETFYEI
jgi:rhodanese-related sulfurtransferase